MVSLELNSIYYNSRVSSWKPASKKRFGREPGNVFEALDVWNRDIYIFPFPDAAR